MNEFAECELCVRICDHLILYYNRFQKVITDFAKFFERFSKLLYLLKKCLCLKVELAIALSLEEPGGAELNVDETGDHSVDFDEQQNGPIPPIEHEIAEIPQADSDDLSDEEGSNAATEGSTLRVSPAEEHERARDAHEGSGGSESESVSGQSSNGGEGVSSQQPYKPPDSFIKVVDVQSGVKVKQEENKHHLVNMKLLRSLLTYMHELKDLDGVRCIPFMQILMLLLSELNAEKEDERELYRSIISTLVAESHLDSTVCSI